ncbi:MAG: type VI secretion system tube protein Hcp [Planctomycetota bacterium]|nr:type VI secretion system tube protein Hcp [Planctomycetota bacterium]
MAYDNFFSFLNQPAKSISGGNLLVLGESQDKMHPKEMELKEFNFSIENPTTIGSATGGAGAGKAKFGEFTIKKSVDIGSVNLFNACAQGCHFPQARLCIRKSGGPKLDYLCFWFLMLYVTKIDWSGGSGEDNPEESITFVYGAMGMQYIAQGSDGTPMQGVAPQLGAWSQLLNQPEFALTAGAPVTPVAPPES